MITAAGEPDPVEAAELHQLALEEQAETRRRQDFAYLATLALLVLRGDATLSTPKPLREGAYGSHFARLMPLCDHDVHVADLHVRAHVDYPAGVPSELAEALLVELTKDV